MPGAPLRSSTPPPPENAAKDSHSENRDSSSDTGSDDGEEDATAVRSGDVAGRSVAPSAFATASAAGGGGVDDGNAAETRGNSPAGKRRARPPAVKRKENRITVREFVGMLRSLGVSEVCSRATG